VKWGVINYNEEQLNHGIYVRLHMGRQEMEEVHYIPRETFQLLDVITLVKWKSFPCIPSSPSRGTSKTQVLLGNSIRSNANLPAPYGS
jgi:hypothetical protein